MDNFFESIELPSVILLWAFVVGTVGHGIIGAIDGYLGARK